MSCCATSRIDCRSIVRRGDLLARVATTNSPSCWPSEPTSLTHGPRRAVARGSPTLSRWIRSPWSRRPHRDRAVSRPLRPSAGSAESRRDAQSARQSAESKIAVYDSAFELYRENDPDLIEELRIALFDGDRADVPLPAQDQRERRQRAQRRGAAALAPSEPRLDATRGIPARRRTRRADAQGGLPHAQHRPRQIRLWRERGIA